MRKYYSFSLTAILLASAAVPAFAQDVQTVPAAGGAQSQQDGVISFTPADFSESRPNTALDMINRLPGFSLESGDNVRGFAGAAGNVLIDGQRPTTKSEGLGDALSRIPIAQVERIDLIRGGAPGIDMQGKNVVANVIRKKADTFQQVAQIGGWMFADTGHTLPYWNYQATRRWGDSQFDVQIARGTSMDDSVGYGWRTRVDAQTDELIRYEAADSEGDGAPYSIRANYKIPFADGRLSLNGLLGTDEFKNESHFISDATDEKFVDRSQNDRGEVGVNWTRPFGDGYELELLGLTKYTQGAGDSTAAFVDGADVLTASFRQEATQGESIGRGVLRYKMSTDLSFEGGGEIAYNFRDQSSRYIQDGVQIPLPLAQVKVEELRGEVFAQSTWRLSPEWSFEGGVRVERSTITQSGDLGKERSFTYPKPRLVATWTPAKDDQVRLLIEREVGQLNFSDFASSVNLSSSVESGGNSDLRPDKTWVYEATYEKRFMEGAAAVLTLRHEDITDVVDLLPFLVDVDTDDDGIDDAQRLVAGPGNIGDGKNDTIALNLTLGLKELGIPGGELKFETEWRNSEVTDPLTGEKRRISGQRPDNLEVSYRHDLPQWNLTYGLAWYRGWEEDYYYLEEIQNLRLHDFSSAFVEWKPDPGFTLRADLQNMDPYKFTIQRQVFAGPRDASPLDYIENERRNSQILGRLTLRWSFG